MEKRIRLDKYLADMGIGTRKEVKNDIRKGKIKVNGITETSPEIKIDIDSDNISVDGKEIGYVSYEYFMFHKPAGCVSATEDWKHKTVIDYIDAKRKDLFPVGRLDIDTEGLLLITNDGDLAHQLLSPKKHVEKVYYARINGIVTNQDIALFEKGLDIGEERLTLPAKLEIIKSDLESEINITITEGKYHQVKRMFEAVEKQVIYLKRLSMGNLKLDEELKPGEYRALREAELSDLKEKV
jgi:16S rRNA pseudouridine516 synthase